MASITIRNLDEGVKKRLRKRAADNGRSLEAEARDILSRSASSASPTQAKTGLDLVRPLLEFVDKYGGVELEIPPRGPRRDVPSFADDARPFRRKK
jgi:plasmid stability protein